MTESILEDSTKLGTSFEAGIGRFSIYSASATEIILKLLAEDQVTVVEELQLSQLGEIWSIESPKIAPGVHYAISVNGPEGPKNSFRPNLNLIDPYARGVVRRSAKDYVNLFLEESFDWQGVGKPKIPLDEVVIYETHARGLTRGNQALSDDVRGTYQALGHEETISHLKKLGVTTIELLPIQMFISEPRLMNMGLINYWGYNTINFFAPQPRYATSASIKKGPSAVVNELKAAIRELHRAGIEVILDVVFNHTAEGGNGGLTYSFRGIDNANYYRQDENGNYIDTTGCGNSLDFSNPWVQKLTLDSLRYWTSEMQVDGFRFDLATTLARDENNHFNPNHPLLKAIEQDDVLRPSKLIVEPWDVGLGGWQTGQFPDRFSEWNDRYRDDVRKFWLSDVSYQRHAGHYPAGVASLATKLAGSVDVVDGPHGVLGGVNFITAHDGFTLRDLVSFNVKHNQANGESNRDGTNNNYSFNFGIEGDTEDDEINATRRRVARNLLATLMVSSGIPMLTAGDERGKTQLGNNNAYCQDNLLSWLNWELAPFQKDLEETTRFLIELRRNHPVLRPKHFANYDEATHSSDRMRWFNSSAELMSEEDWQDSNCRSFARLTDHLNQDGTIDSMLVVIHGEEKDLDFQFPLLDNISRFELLYDSNWERPQAASELATPASYKMAPLSVVVARVI